MKCALHCSRRCVWPRISHIWHLSSPPLYPSLPPPAHNPAIILDLALVKQIFDFWETVQRSFQCCQICCTPILLVLAQGSDFSACCIIFRASSSPFFALFSNHPVACSLIRSQISTVRKKYQKWLVISTLSVYNVHIAWSKHQIIFQTSIHIPIVSCFAKKNQHSNSNFKM